MRSLAEIFKPTFGPTGSYKVLMNSMGQYVVTKDGATILKELDIGYPGLRMIARISKVMEDEIGDGTKLAVILTGALLEKADMLLSQGLHPAVIMEGYKLAAEMGIRAINDLAMDVEKNPFLRQVAKTSMTDRTVRAWTDHLVDIAEEAVEHLIGGDADKIDFDPGDILLIKKHGGAVKDN
jgi:chaperonin GroEL (HSP60 family)